MIDPTLLDFTKGGIVVVEKTTNCSKMNIATTIVALAIIGTIVGGIWYFTNKSIGND